MDKVTQKMGDFFRIILLNNHTGRAILKPYLKKGRRMNNKLTEIVYDQWTKAHELSELIDYSEDEELLENNLKDFVSDLISTDNDFPFFMGTESDTESFIETIIDTVYNQIDKEYIVELIQKDVKEHVEVEGE